MPLARRVLTLALVGTLAGCAAEEAVTEEATAKDADREEATVAVDTDDVATTSLNTYISKAVGEKQGTIKGGN